MYIHNAEDSALHISVMSPTNVPRHEETRSAHNEDHDSHSILRSKTKEKRRRRRRRLRRRREWQWQQERERQHEKLKQQKILEYEKKRAQALGYAEPKSVHHSRSKSSSKSPSQDQHKGRSVTHVAQSDMRFEKIEEETLRRRCEWQRQQERERQHEKLKRQKILEYEKKRAQALGYAEPKSVHHSRSKSSSKSPSQDQHKGRFVTRVAQSDMLFEKIEEERLRRRREWQRQQERERQHEKLKRQKILEYERKRAQALGYAEPKSVHSRSKSSSKSPSQDQHKGRSVTRVAQSDMLFEKLERSTNETIPLFKGPEGIQISTTELGRIKVDIRRNIPVKGPIPDLQRNIVNAEDVILKRREGEGSKPIFDRKEIKKANEIKEKRRTVVATDEEQQSDSTDKSQTSKKRSSLSSPILYGSEYLSSHQSSPKSHTRSLMEEKSYSNRYHDRSSEHSRKRKNRNRDRDRERDRSRERRRDRDRDRSRERKDVASHYVKPPIHVPIYYNLPPRPIVVSPMVPFRGQVPPMGRGRHSALMAPVRPFPPRFIPPDMYRLGPPPPNPRYGPF